MIICCVDAFDLSIAMDDCVYLLLQRGDAYAPNLKEMGHLYLYEKNVSESLLSIGFHLHRPPVDVVLSFYRKAPIPDKFSRCSAHDTVRMSEISIRKSTKIEMGYTGEKEQITHLMSLVWPMRHKYTKNHLETQSGRVSIGPHLLVHERMRQVTSTIYQAYIALWRI